MNSKNRSHARWSRKQLMMKTATIPACSMIPGQYLEILSRYSPAGKPTHDRAGLGMCPGTHAGVCRVVDGRVVDKGLGRSRRAGRRGTTCQSLFGEEMRDVAAKHSGLGQTLFMSLCLFLSLGVTAVLFLCFCVSNRRPDVREESSGLDREASCFVERNNCSVWAEGSKPRDVGFLIHHIRLGDEEGERIIVMSMFCRSVRLERAKRVRSYFVIDEL
ncbi:hypothetical protein PoB_005814700 [Plakobranchus ocellatus]|uniref:Uncharacterized protein n=1 Tax=Plakobranchus ocellatus TaxID=259542 RepID=A0AAV4CJF3_9GAST|nr:hypothetical protein PoB_005814700 [Plakobranchus ocellatus]